MSKYFFDMDGVLFDWNAGFMDMFGRTPESMTEEEFQQAKADLSDTAFFENLPIIPEGWNLFHSLLNMGEEVAILTSVGKYNSDWVAHTKMKSLERVLGYLPEFHYTKSSKEKAKYAGQGVLIDDRMKSVGPFRAAGGEAILFVNYKPEPLLAA